MEPAFPTTCPACGTTLDSASLSCSSCGRLTRSAELQVLSAEAQKATAAGDLVGSRNAWGRAALLLPVDTVQHRSVAARIAELDATIAAAQSKPPSRWRTLNSALAPIAVVAWKFKALLLGLTKISTLLSMVAFFGVYWSLYGWALALGLVLSIYIHEMGHVIALRGFGVPASAPMFIPGLGAFIFLRSHSIAPVQDSRVGLAGPLYGLGAALFSWAVYAATGAKIWAVIAHFGAVINLFNLIPVWQLDGSRGFHSFTRPNRVVVIGCAGILWLITHQAMLFLIALGGAYRLFTKDAAAEPDNTGLLQFVGLLVALAAVTVFAPLQ